MEDFFLEIIKIIGKLLISILLRWFLAQIVENVLEKLNLASNAFILLVSKAKLKFFKFLRNQKTARKVA